MQASWLKPPRSLALAAAATALAGLAMGWLVQSPGDGPPAAMSRSPGDVSPASTASVVPASPAAANGSAVSDMPPGVTQAQWQALQAEMRARPDGAAELARIAEYLRWSDLVQRLRVPITDDAERLRLAHAIDAGLEARLRAGEVSAAEARQVKAATLEITQVDAAARAAELQRWSTALAAPARPDPRQAEFERSQAAAVAAWSAQPAATRDPATLERELEALRRQHFAATAAPVQGGSSR